MAKARQGVDTGAESGWQPIGHRTWQRRLVDGSVALVPASAVGYLAFNVGPSIAHFIPSSGAARLGIGLLAAVLSTAVVVGVWIVRNPVPSVDFDSNRIRIRGRAIDIGQIDTARVLIAPSTSKRSGKQVAPSFSGIRIGVDGGTQISLALGGGSDAAEHEYRQRLAEVIRRSSIRYPRSAYDPAGRFAQYNFPEYLDKENALGFVLFGTPPRAKD